MEVLQRVPPRRRQGVVRRGLRGVGVVVSLCKWHPLPYRQAVYAACS